MRKHWVTIALILIAGYIFYVEYHSVADYPRWEPTGFINPFFEAMGKWGIRFLLLSLAITPIYRLTGWRFPIRLRKPAGLIAFGFITVHAGIYVFYNRYPLEVLQTPEIFVEPSFVAAGFGAFLILALMAATSFKFMMRRMGRNWKRLHRLVYVAAVLMMVHSIAATGYGKRASVGGPESRQELLVYLVILIVLLMLRVPIIRDTVKGALTPIRRKRTIQSTT